MDKKNHKNGIFIPHDRITSISIILTLVFVLACGSLYFGGYNSGVNNVKTAEITNNLESNIGGLAFQQPVAECILYSDEIVISDESCTHHDDCFNGICFENKCAFFVR